MSDLYYLVYAPQIIKFNPKLCISKVSELLQRDTVAANAGGAASQSFLALPLPELQKKFQLLAEEFTRIKTQNAVLKKAVLQEQEKNKKLQTEVKEKDIRLRAASEETDTLSFNNQRLTKRVEALQKAVEEERSKAAQGGWFGAGAKQELLKVKEDLQLVQDELAAKIKENESLHVRVFEERKEHSTTLQTLEDKMGKLKSALTKKSTEYDDLQTDFKHSVSKMTSERETLSHHVEELNDTIARTKALMQQREHAMTQVQQKLTADLEGAQGVLAEKVIFNDSKNASLNQLNIPSFDRTFQKRQQEMISVALGLGKKTMEALRDVQEAEHEQLLLANRSPDLPDSIRNLNRKMTGFHSESIQALSTFYEALKAHLSPAAAATPPAPAQASLVEATRKLSAVVKKLASYRTLKLSAESSAANCRPEGRVANEALSTTEAAIPLALEKVLSYIVIFFGPGDVSVSRGNLVFALRKLLGSAATVRDLLKERSSQYSAKVAIEAQADPFVLPEVKARQDKIVIGLASAASLLDKQIGLLGQYLDGLTNSIRFVRGAQTQLSNGLYTLNDYADKSKKYLLALNESGPEPKSVAYEDQLANLALIADLKLKLQHEVVARDTQIEALKQQISVLQKDKSGLQSDVTGLKDSLAAKQSSLSELLADLADTRQKLSQMTILYQKQLVKTKEATALILTNPGPSNPSTQGPTTDGPSPTATVDSMLVSELVGQSPFDMPPVYDASHNTVASGDLLGLDLGLQPPPYPKGDDLLLDTLQRQQPSPSTPAQGELLSLDAATDTLSASEILASDLAVESLAEATPALSRGGPSDARASATAEPNGTKSKRWNMVVLDEAGRQSDSLPFSIEDKEREAQLKKFYEDKYTLLRSQLEIADKKGVELFQIKAELHAALTVAVKERDILQGQIAELTVALSRAKEEVDTTRENYETQLKVMTEHLVQLNEKIGGFEEELGTLKNCTVCCGKCKTWNKVGWLLTEGKNGQRCCKGNHPSSFNYA